MRCSTAATVLTYAIFTTSTAAAEAPPPRAPTAEAAPAPPTITTRYGAQIIVGEFAGVSAAGLGAAVGGEAGLWLGAGAWMLTGPAIHLAHGNAGRAVVSVALRQGLLWTGALIGAQVPCAHPSEHNECHIRGAFGGALIGYGAAVIIDALFVARSTHAAPTRAPRWSPTLAASPGGASVGVAGVF